MQAVGSSRQEERKDRKEVQKESRMIRVYLNSMTWSTEKKYKRRYKGTFEIFFRVERRNEERRDGGAVQQRS